jgi:fructose-1,6-bisphosphatase/inositol monophosphatase family enzyme
MSTLTCKFFLEGDERTYWTLLVQENTKGSDILEQVSRKMQLKSAASLSLAAVVRGESDGLVSREHLKPHDAVFDIAALVVRSDDAASKFVIFQRPDIGPTDGRMLFVVIYCVVFFCFSVG